MTVMRKKKKCAKKRVIKKKLKFQYCKNCLESNQTENNC